MQLSSFFFSLFTRSFRQNTRYVRRTLELIYLMLDRIAVSQTASSSCNVPGRVLCSHWAQCELTVTIFSWQGAPLFVNNLKLAGRSSLKQVYLSIMYLFRAYVQEYVPCSFFSLILFLTRSITGCVTALQSIGSNRYCSAI